MITPIFPKTEAEFRYHNVGIQNIFLVLWTAMGVGISIFSFHVKATGRERQKGVWFGVLLLGLAVIFLGALSLIDYFKTSREIVVDDDGVAALAFGRAWRFIPWTEVIRIERIRRSIGHRVEYPA